MLQRFEAFVTGITVCHKYIQKIKSMEMTEFDLKGTHAMCLFFLHRAEDGLTAAQLSQLCAEDKAAISRTIGVLQERGYVKMGARKYRAPLCLTESGVALACHVDALIARWVSVGGDGLTEEERATFYYALDHIAGNLREKLDQPD